LVVGHKIARDVCGVFDVGHEFAPKKNNGWPISTRRA
jgi:hypothetical protein